MNYEEAIQALENIINQLENDNQTLDDSLALYEQGQKIAQHCADLLKNAELRIRTLTETEND
ncbi:MAG TPA: exodeoxyribonuclease VII small subunit [Chloroflexi bacterium]|nr:exodeoxyribonuclease VII small subunit [Chloroflexota bacterium]